MPWWCSRSFLCILRTHPANYDNDIQHTREKEWARLEVLKMFFSPIFLFHRRAIAAVRARKLAFKIIAVYFHSLKVMFLWHSVRFINALFFSSAHSCLVPGVDQTERRKKWLNFMFYIALDRRSILILNLKRVRQKREKRNSLVMMNFSYGLFVCVFSWRF